MDEKQSEKGTKPTFELNDNGKNAKVFVCDLCGCIILDKDKATLITKEVSLPKTGNNKDLEKLDKFWDVKDKFDFWNIAVSRTDEAKSIKYLTCADCERPMLGINFINDQPDHYYVAASRIKYNDSLNS